MKNIKKYQPWNIISPFDLAEANTRSPVPKKPKSRSSTTTRNSSPITIRKSLPKQINSLSHLLTPTQSSMHKKVQKPKKLTKSKSASDLRGKNETDEKRLKEEEILNELCRKVAEIEVGTESTNGFRGRSQRKSCPEYLKIDVEQIEREFDCSSYLRNGGDLDRGAQDVVGFSVEKAGLADLMDGKIFCSRLVEVREKGGIREDWNSGIGGFVDERRRRRRVGEEECEVVVEEETESFSSILDSETCSKFNFLVVAYQSSLLKSTLSIFHKLKPLKLKSIEPSSSRRKSRSLADVSNKISVLIQSSLSKPVCALQRPFDAPPTPATSGKSSLSSLDYCKSQDCIFNLILTLISPGLKPLLTSSISLLSKCKYLTQALQQPQPSPSPPTPTPASKLPALNEIIAISLTTGQLSQAQAYLLHYPEQNSAIFTLWRTLLCIIKQENLSYTFESISSQSKFGEFSTLSKLASVYSFYFSCYWLKSSRSVAYARSLGLGEWEEIVVFDLMLRNGDRSSEETAEQGLSKVLQSASQVLVKFLAFYRMFLLFKGYNQYSKALNLIKLAEKGKFNADLKDLLDCCSMKIYAKLGLDLQINSDVLLVKYQYSRLSLKHRPQAQLDKILLYLNEICAHCQELSIEAASFAANFWKFILLRNLKLQKLTQQQAELSLALASQDKLKTSAVQDYLKSLLSLDDSLKKLEIYSQGKDLSALSRALAGLEKLDPYLSACFQMIVRPSSRQEKFLMERFEGFFAVWSQSYRKSKAKEKVFKGLEGQEEIDKRDRSHPLHILVKIKEHWKEIAWIYENSFSASPGLLWGLFGKSFGRLSLKHCYRVMQAKSYIRTNVLRGVHKLQKEEDCPVIVYYIAKLSISVIKYEKTASDSSFQSIFLLLKKFSNATGIHLEYQVKVLYMQAELAFMTKSYQ